MLGQSVIFSIWKLICMFFFFFFKQKTAYEIKCDWSSDVCSSDLFEDVEPPWVVKARGHVVGDDVQDKAHAVCAYRIAQFVELFDGADFRIELCRVRDVVSMHAARPGLQDRRSVKIADSQLMKIIDDSTCIREAKLPVELQPVCRYRNPHAAFCN